MVTQVYLASTLELMYSNDPEEVDNIVNNSICNKIGDIIYFILNNTDEEIKPEGEPNNVSK